MLKIRKLSIRSKKKAEKFKNKRTLRKYLRTVMILAFFYFTIISNSISQHTGFKEIKGLNSFSFTPFEKKVLPGKSEEKTENESIQNSDIIGNLGLVSLYYQNGCYTDGLYNNNDFAVEKGEITDSIRNLKYDAYKIYEPSHKATKFLASKHNVFYRFPTKEHYSIYQLKENSLEKIIEINENEIRVNGFTKIGGLTVSEINESATYVIIPKNTESSIYNKINTNVEATCLKQTSLGNIYKMRYSVEGSLFDNTSNYYDKNRHYFCSNLETEKTAVVWQDLADFSLHCTTIDQNIETSTTIELPNPNKGFLAAVTANSQGDFFYLTIFEKTGMPVDVTISKINIVTGLHNINRLDASVEMDMFVYGNETASMSISKDKILLLIARTMNLSDDGMHHQGGIAVSFDANNLSLLKNYGQTSGHSFDNFLSVSSSGDFIGIDLGDNYPRGINLHRINENKNSKVIYTFKTKHGETAGYKTYPAYDEISTTETQYYKWSNDNKTYTELGAVIETDDGFMITFLGEPDKNGSALNNSEVNKFCSKNIGFVKVKKNFDDGSNDIFLSKGINETGGFYTFGGRWCEQKNMGLVWITKYTDYTSETAKYLKSVKIRDGEILFLWEKWAGDEYTETLALKTNENGELMGNIVALGNQLRLDRRNDILVKENQVIIVNGNNHEKKLEFYIVDLKQL
jgi:hypothetical protein